MLKITVLGATGSIGVNTLDVIRSHRDKYSIYALTAHSRIDILLAQCLEFKPVYAVVVDEHAASELRLLLKAQNCCTEVLSGPEELISVSSDFGIDIVVAAIVGGAGLPPTFAAVKAGKKVLLANKESLVMSGKLFMDAVKTYDAQLLPVDSEHNAIFQCLPERYTTLADAGIQRILLTGSGGPFRQTPMAELSAVTPEQACSHPNWSMGKKISVDSATMMNKGLEYIEACWLFGAEPKDIEIVVHPQSIIHSMVEYADGSVLAQMGQPDMRTPIANCLGWPERICSNASSLDFKTLSALTFEAPDFERFDGLKLAVEVASSGGSYAIALNAANEIAVDAFLSGSIKFNEITQVLRQTIDAWQSCEPSSIDDVLDADRHARQIATTICFNME